jgi:hypothetical protein
VQFGLYITPVGFSSTLLPANGNVYAFEPYGGDHRDGFPPGVSLVIKWIGCSLWISIAIIVFIPVDSVLHTLERRKDTFCRYYCDMVIYLEQPTPHLNIFSFTNLHVLAANLEVQKQYS